jgi:hypothetical protein
MLKLPGPVPVIFFEVAPSV